MDYSEIRKVERFLFEFSNSKKPSALAMAGSDSCEFEVYMGINNGLDYMTFETELIRNGSNDKYRIRIKNVE